MKNNSILLVIILFSLLFEGCKKPDLAGNWIEIKNFKNPLAIHFFGESANIRNLDAYIDTFNFAIGWNSVVYRALGATNEILNYKVLDCIY